jgi:hypothetical protein
MLWSTSGALIRSFAASYAASRTQKHLGSCCSSIQSYTIALPSHIIIMVIWEDGLKYSISILAGCLLKLSFGSDMLLGQGGPRIMSSFLPSWFHAWEMPRCSRRVGFELRDLGPVFLLPEACALVKLSRGTKVPGRSRSRIFSTGSSTGPLVEAQATPHIAYEGTFNAQDVSRWCGPIFSFSSHRCYLTIYVSVKSLCGPLI